jgi:hypothetical protein
MPLAVQAHCARASHAGPPSILWPAGDLEPATTAFGTSTKVASPHCPICLQGGIVQSKVHLLADHPSRSHHAAA